eukprot:647500-Hanusia_phi.AAC.1
MATEAPKLPKTPKEKDTAQRLIVVLEKACLETVKSGNSYELLNCDDHVHLLKKFKRDPADCRPDITHQMLLTLLDSPLNKSGKLQVYIHTEKNVLIEVSPHIRIPRTRLRTSSLPTTRGSMVQARMKSENTLDSVNHRNSDSLTTIGSHIEQFETLFQSATLSRRFPSQVVNEFYVQTLLEDTSTRPSEGRLLMLNALKHLSP